MEQMKSYQEEKGITSPISIPTIISSFVNKTKYSIWTSKYWFNSVHKTVFHIYYSILK